MKSTNAGDWAIVNVQSSSWSSAEAVRCVINLAVAPEPWLRWSRENLGPLMPKAVSESLGLFRTRLHPDGTPAGTDGWWEVGADQRSASVAAADMVNQLARSGWDVLDRLLTPGGMLRQVREGDLGDMKRGNFGVYFARAEAVLLMDAGPSEALDEKLAFALEHVMPQHREHAERFDGWVREQARNARRN